MSYLTTGIKMYRYRVKKMILRRTGLTINRWIIWDTKEAKQIGDAFIDRDDAHREAQRLNNG